jgi:acyl-CoA synthetase (NDP forming)
MSTGSHPAASAARELGAALQAARDHGAQALTEPEAKRLLAAFGITVPRSVTGHDPERLVAEGNALGGPLVAKIVADSGLHKSDIGGVRLGLRGEQALREALATIGSAAAQAGVQGSGFLIETMAEPGAEIVIGATLDERFGPVIMLGLGGIFVEIFADTQFRVCPITAADARAMISSLRARPLLEGARGRAAVDTEALVQALVAVGGAGGLMMSAAGAIAELDINPLIVSRSGATACDARMILASRAEDVATPADADAPLGGAEAAPPALRFLFEPTLIAVAGASATGFTPANDFIRQCRALGCTARIVPIHPSAAEVEGLPAVRGIAEIGATVDYLYISIAAVQVPALIASCAGRVRFAQVISSGFGEVEHGRQLERDLLAAARQAGVRLLGPNCLGVYSPRGGLAFVGDCPREPGPIGIVSQSGGLAVDMLLRGRQRGLRFSGLATLGNSVDLGPADLIDHFLDDPDTRAIGVYVEDVRDGRRFFEALTRARGRKPVVILLGGQTAQGRKAAASHTGSLASPLAIWRGLSAQTGAVITDTLDQFLDALIAFQSLGPRRDRPTRRCVLFGNGGGTSVLAADAFGRRGLDVEPMNDATIAALDALKLPPGTSVVNPVDAPAFTLRQEEGRVAETILDIIVRLGAPHALVTHLNLPVFISSADQRADFLGNLMAATLRVRARYPEIAHHLLVLRSDGSEACEARKRSFRAAAVAAGLPAFDELVNAADALAAIAHYERSLAPAR